MTAPPTGQSQVFVSLNFTTTLWEVLLLYLFYRWKDRGTNGLNVIAGV